MFKGKMPACARLQTLFALVAGLAWAADDFPKPYSPPATERENVFEFTRKPTVRNLGEDRDEITFAVKGNCDVTVDIVDASGFVVRHLGSGVLGSNAPAPFQKNSLQQTLIWNGKDDLGDYVKEPGKMKVRVQLGLKPEFEKRLGVTNPKIIPGQAWAICSDEKGVYAFYCVRIGYTLNEVRVRKFDHDGNYVRTLFPPAANLPEEKLEGLGFVEYEAGKRSLHLRDLSSTHGAEAAGCLTHIWRMPKSCRPAIVGDRIYYCTDASERLPSMLYFVRTDGSLEAQGVEGRSFLPVGMERTCLAASPDGKWLYAAGDERLNWNSAASKCAVFRRSLEDDRQGGVFLGELYKPGSDNSRFGSAHGIDCDAQGRIFVSDNVNNRIQVFTPEGRHAKTIALDHPGQISVHRKSGAIYVMHTPREQGKSVNRISKLASYDHPTVESHLNCPVSLMMLDSWTAKPRIWLFGEIGGDNRESMNVRILEEDGGQFRKLADFNEEVKAEAEKSGAKDPLSWIGDAYANRGKMVCDPVREQAYYMNSLKFDLKTGAFLGSVQLGPSDDIAFDKKGYLHCHFNPSIQPGVARLDPSRPGSGPGVSHPECPYDYGEEAGRWLGILPVRDQLGAKFFQDGVGVNMIGDVAEECNIYWIPKLEAEGASFALQGLAANQLAGNYTEESNATNERYVKEMEKKGLSVYSIKRQPGVPLAGATSWTFDRSGELRDECAVTAGGFINGVMLDEEGATYFVNNRIRLINGKPFLAGKGGVFGSGREAKVTDPATKLPGARQPEPFTGTLIKVRRKGTLLSTTAHVPLDERPARPPELSQYREEAWIDGAEWLYAGASPIVPGGCSCPTMRFHTDWYKRTFVPEAYRHSIGVLDTAGNLILHCGQYGNFDSGYGPASKVPVGGDGIAFSDGRMVSGTDQRLCFTDRGERIIVLKLNYHAEETAPITPK